MQVPAKRVQAMECATGARQRKNLLKELDDASNLLCNESLNSTASNESTPNSSINSVGEAATVIERRDSTKQMSIEEEMERDGPGSWENLHDFMLKCSIPNKAQKQPSTRFEA